jgi:hypothetical protein
MDTLFDPPPAARASTHACTGPGCYFCAWLDGRAAKTKAVKAVKYDPRWLHEAVEWRRSRIGLEVTADDLIACIGLPDGHPAQIGALFSQWAQAGMIRLTGTHPQGASADHEPPLAETGPIKCVACGHQHKAGPCKCGCHEQIG